MFSEEVIPYLSDQALRDETRDISFPLLIEVNDISYAAALAVAKRVFESLSTAAEGFHSDSVETSLHPIEDTLATETVAELKHSKRHSTVCLYVSVSARFAEAMDLWTKLEFITKILDAIREFASGYDSNKQVRVLVGVHHRDKRT